MRLNAQNVDVFISRLPDDIIRHIYEEYIKTEFHFKIFKQLLRSKTSMKLNTSDIRPYIPYILSNPKLCDYMREHLVIGDNFKIFDAAYVDHKIKNEKMFTLAKNGTSVCLSLLMYVYH